ncbi:DUF6702 family protein [uncultured Sphingomonas sp.]|uniref:DUF6702 family protein n=1 Tax=uncultured Sphingomonas sp. TaxID=158754 RepID=UPI0025DB8A27|nr:DUF6702 family protein [uncultured Sphingomonas sp.]
MRRTDVRRWILALALLAAPAAAHRGHDALTVVTLGAANTVTVSHRFEAHDIEPALSSIAPDAQASLDDPDAVRALVAYLGRRFVLSDAKGAVALTPGKVDIDAQEVRVAFTGKVQPGTKALTVRSSVLRDVYPRQTNQVEVRRGKTVRTLIVSDGAAHRVTLP